MNITVRRPLSNLLEVGELSMTVMLFFQLVVLIRKCIGLWIGLLQIRFVLQIPRDDAVHT